MAKLEEHIKDGTLDLGTVAAGWEKKGHGAKRSAKDANKLGGSHT